MRLEFNSTLSHAEQLMLTSAYKQPGRKHNHQPSSRAKERIRSQKMRGAKIINKQSKMFHEKVAAYWRGEGETYPTGLSK